MLKKIISGGQTGADRAALDTAIKFNLEHGGSVPAGRRSEDGTIPDKYDLTEMDTDSYPERTKQNIIDSDGTVIISHGVLTGGSFLTKKLASKLNKPWYHIDLMEMDEFEGAVTLHDFVSDNYIEILNVAGPRASQDPFIYRSVKSIIETFIYMELMESSQEELRADDIILLQRKTEKFCATLNEAVEFLADTMHLRTRSVIANSPDNQIGSLYFSLADTIKVKLGLDAGNTDLFESCRKELRKGNTSKVQHIHKLDLSKEPMDIEDAAMVILKALRQYLKKNHVLRVIK
ncbi:MAG: putative molybdenum carrier protein [Desulfamplus sp.]|nr:putative molybdenum carrier protein [Desulfamplus sp.]MBF0210959.1 putative molybdenum carrier protein [Desulfamplus sp.]